MAVIRNTASALANGRIGNTTYYVANGQQIARQAQNNSNYGESASRSDAQQSRRVRWSNLVNGYKAMATWLKKAYETKKQTQSDYNKFMQLNINSSSVALTKDMAANGCSVWESWQVSQGSLPQVGMIAQSLGIGVKSDIALSGEIASDATIAAVSQDIINNNPTFKNGDNIAFIAFNTSLDGRGYPYSTSSYYEFTLDTSNTNLYSSLEFASVVSSDYTNQVYTLGTIQNASSVTASEGFVFIHTRKVGGNLQVSSQSIFMQSEAFVNQFSSDAAIQAAIDSYGVDTEVPLDPTFLKASFVRATTNGADILGGIGRTYEVTGQQTLVVTGRHMTDDNVQLFNGDVAYTPLSREDGSWTYILGDNGTYSLYVNGNFYLGLAISGVVVPEGLPVILRMRQQAPESVGSDYINTLEIVTDCINYPFKVNEDYPRFWLRIGSTASPFTDVEGYEFYNCAGAAVLSDSGQTVTLKSIVTDPTSPAYITYQGFIIAVFNY